MIGEEATPRAVPIWRPARPSAVAIVAIAIAALVAAAGTAGIVLRGTPIYQSHAVLLIDQPGLIAKAGSEGVVVKLNQLRAKYGALARTEPITGPVAQRLGIPPGRVAAAIGVSLPGPSLVLVIVARSDSPARARDIANGVSDQLKAYVAAEQQAANIPQDERILLSTVSVARPGAKVEPTRGRAILYGVLAGLIVLVGGFALSQVRPRARPSA